MIYLHVMNELAQVLPVPWTISKPLKLSQIRLYSLARQPDGAINSDINEIVQILTPRSGITLITDRMR